MLYITWKFQYLNRFKLKIELNTTMSEFFKFSFKVWEICFKLIIKTTEKYVKIGKLITQTTEKPEKLIQS